MVSRGLWETEAPRKQGGARSGTDIFKNFQGQESIGSYRFVIKSKMKNKGVGGDKRKTVMLKRKPEWYQKCKRHVSCDACFAMLLDR